MRRALDLVTMLGSVGVQQFGQAVGPGAEVVAAVELGPVGLAREAVVGAAVDDEGAGGQGRGDLAGLAVRQGEEDDVVTGEILGGRRDEGQVGERTQVGLQRDERLPGVLESGDGGDGELRVRGEQPQELTPGIAACAGYGNGK